jgi:quercetin dioxygenase-like cupin family protein
MKLALTRKSDLALRIFVLVVSLVVCLQAATPETYPTPYPRPNATSVLQNSRVNAWEVYWPKGQPTPMHEHTIDQLSITLRGGTVRVTTPEGKVTEGHSAPGMVVFTKHGTIHQEEGTSDVPQHKIMLEIKPSEPSTQIVHGFPPDGAVKSLDNDRLTTWDYTWKPGVKVPMHLEDFDSVTVFVVGGTVRSVDTHGVAKTDERKAGDVIYTPRGSETLTEEAAAGSPRAIIVQLK